MCRSVWSPRRRDALFKRATATGPEVIRRLQDEDNGPRGFTVRDPEGTLWNSGIYHGV